MAEWLELIDASQEDDKCVWGFLKQAYSFLELSDWIKHQEKEKQQEKEERERKEKEKEKKEIEEIRGEVGLGQNLLKEAKAILKGSSIRVIALVLFFPLVEAAPAKQQFPDISFKAFNKFVERTFSSDVSLATVLAVLFSLTENMDLLNLHARQIETLFFPGEYPHTWIKQATALSSKLDDFVELLSLTPYDWNNTLGKKLLPVSYDSIHRVQKCQPRALLQTTRTSQIPLVTLLKEDVIYKDVPVLIGKCTTCDTTYHADHERFKDHFGIWNNCYLNSAQFLKVGQSTWVDRKFGHAVLSGIYNFHASASAYTQFWNDCASNSGVDFMLTRCHTWQTFIQDTKKIDLELKENLNINEVTKEVYAILGNAGIIELGLKHSCSQCHQPYKEVADLIGNEDPAAVLGADSNSAVPSLVGEYAAQSAHETTQARQQARIQAERIGNNDEMNVDYDDVNMIVSHYFNSSRFYCVETICAPCGVVIAWTKFDKSESPTKILNFLKSVYPTQDSCPNYICIDKACKVLQTSIANRSWDTWQQTSCFIVDSYHYINHCTTDYLCCKWCNPAPLDGSAPNLVKVAKNKEGNDYLQRAFNTQACEQLNSWLGGFEGILKQMMIGNFDWLLHTMLLYHTQQIEDPDEDDDDNDDNPIQYWDD
ncbi:hypothetical protein CPB84DRAFT_1893787 [Gymnopilus junonius]|uniref:CxC5 like cysteine cluster associated with KDZ domain-containing protein n=1 Tax=Gymnopilus junonius TaxID=109634 RepID=A0A9P5TPM9_GYMJU|nr:hypothetical protein CPB84DRAFT_1893787 [Gymnopilus junonius]